VACTEAPRVARCCQGPASVSSTGSLARLPCAGKPCWRVHFPRRRSSEIKRLCFGLREAGIRTSGWGGSFPGAFPALARLRLPA
jgi:hypothetical protein